MGGSSNSNTQSTQSNTVNPAQMAQYQQNYNNAQNTAGLLNTPFSGQLTAALNPTQVQAENQAAAVGTNPTYTGNLTGATSAVQGVLGNQANPTITPQTVSASTVANTNLAPYMNPYQNDVIDATQNEFNTENAQQLNNTNQSSTAAGAFGGSRSGVADALTNQLDTQAEAPTIAGLNASNFTNAENMAATDAATNNAVNEFNSGQNVGAQQETFQNSATNATNTMNAANTIAALTGQNFNMAANQAGLLGNVGQQQQSQQQTADTNAYNAWLEQMGLSQNAQQLQNQALGIIPVQQTVNSNSNTNTSTNPGIGGILGSIGSLGLAAAMPGTAGIGGPTSLLSGLFGFGSSGQTSGASMGYT